MNRVDLGLHEKRLSILFHRNLTSCNVGEYQVMKNYRRRRGIAPGILDLSTGQGRVVKLLLLSEKEVLLLIQYEAGRTQSKDVPPDCPDCTEWYVPANRSSLDFYQSQNICYLCHSYRSENPPLLMGNAASAADGSS